MGNIDQGSTLEIFSTFTLTNINRVYVICVPIVEKGLTDQIAKKIYNTMTYNA